MTVKFNGIGYVISEGIKSVFKQKKMTGASIIIMCATMFMFGIFFLIGENINFAMEQLESQQGIRVMIKDEVISDGKEETLKAKINQIPGVNKVEFISKEDALSTVRTWIAGNKNSEEILSGYDEDNPFPASFFVTLTDLTKNDEVQKQILKLDGVDEISSNNDLLSKLASIAKSVQMITLGLLAILVLISIFIISYTIKLTVYARRKEISIMKYVGATNSFIRGPFIVEGIIIGIISAIITIGIIGVAYTSVLNKMLVSSVMQSLTISLYTFNQLFVRILIVYLILGIGIGVLGSVISMRKYLKV